MADLKTIARKHNINFDNRHTPTLKQDKAEGRFRRPWLESIEEKVNPDLIGSKQGLNRVESASKQGLNRVKESLNAVETGFKQSLNRVENEYIKTGSKQGLNRVKDLRGNPLKVMCFLVKNIILEQDYVTEKLSVFDIAKGAKISRNSVKTALKYLLKFNAIFRNNSHTGIHGWTSYFLKEELVDDFRRSGFETGFKQGLNRVQTGGISSSSNINTTTNIELDNIWDEIDISPLAEIGFTQAHLKQIAARTELTPGQVQESIEMFAFDLRENNKAKDFKKSPLDAFMGILGKGGIYTPPSNYETPQAREMRLYVERKKAIEEKSKAQEVEAMNFAFKDWLSSVPVEQQELICKPTTMLKGARMAELRMYYEQHLWPEARKKILQGA